MAKSKIVKKPLISVENKKEQSTIFEKIYFGFFLLLPLIYSETIVDPVLIPRQLFLTIFLFIIGFIIKSQIKDNKLEFDFSFLKLPVFIACFILLLSILISFKQSIVLSESLYVFSKVSVEILFLIITTFLIIQKQLSTKSILKSMLTFLTIVLLIAIYQALKLSISEENFIEKMYDIKSTIAHKNLLSSLLFLLFPFVFIALFKSKPVKIIAIVLGILTFIIIWLIQTRTVFLAFGLYTIVFIFLEIRYHKNGEGKNYLRQSLVIISLLIVFFSVITIQNKDKFARIFNKDSAFERFSMWGNSFQMIKENYLFGVGAGNWQIHFPENGLDKFPDYKVREGLLTYQRPHNDYLWIFSELGITGIIAYILIFIFILYYSIKLLKSKKDKDEKWLISAFISVLVGYLVIAFLDFPLERIEHQIVLFLIFSLIIAEYHSNFKKELKFKVNNTLLFSLFLFCTIFSSIVCVNRFKGEKHTHNLYVEHKNLNWEEMIYEADNSINTFYKLDATTVPIEWYKGVAQFSLENVNEAKKSFEKAQQLHPFNIHVLNNLASCYEKLGKHEKAIEYYKRAIIISSNFEEAKLNLSASYYNSDNFKSAFQTIDNCKVHGYDAKYAKFLPFILVEKVKIIAKSQKNSTLINKLNILINEPEKIVNIYKRSKDKNCIFEKYLLLII